MTRAQAPGKLFIAGEYAVVEPGEQAVLVAVDRFITVTVTLSGRAAGGLIASSKLGWQPRAWERGADGLPVPADPLDYVSSTLLTVEQLVSERAMAPQQYDVEVASDLDDADGRKLGLGSSAAVTVALARALNEHYGLGLSQLQLLKLALIATVRVSPRASGGDVAASIFGGWISYRSPDRDWVRDAVSREGVAAMLTREWPLMSVGRLVPPRDLRLVVGWTGSPASTDALVERSTHEASESPDAAAAHSEFIAGSRETVESLISALDTGDTVGVLAAIHRARELLRSLPRGTQIETPKLSALSDAARLIRGVGKPSGAGGGDCGIVLAPADAPLDGMLAKWAERDIRHLNIAVHEDRGGDAGEPSGFEPGQGGGNDE